jgi:hypothetical protein
LGRVLRKGNIDIDPGTHLKSGRGRQPWDDLKVPMIIVLHLVLDGGRVDDVIIVRVV